MKWLLGSAGFILFLFYDWNSVKLNKSWMKVLFPIGCFSVLASSVLAVREDLRSGFMMDIRSVIAIILACLCLGFLVYTLFFALPFSDTYVEDESGRSVCDTGMYAFCRHPGVIWFFLSYLFGGLALQGGALLSVGMMMSVWNLGYVVFQDRYTFIRCFSDYERYQRQTPFLIPNKKSLIRGLATWTRRGEKNEI